MSDFSAETPKKRWQKYFCWPSKILILNSKIMYPRLCINIHQRIKLEGCTMWTRVSVCSHYTSGGIYVCEHPACVRACIQRAPIGMNYLEESLFCLCTVHRPQARKVLLPTSQETTLIHHPPFCSMPPSRPPSWAFPSMQRCTTNVTACITVLFLSR